MRFTAFRPGHLPFLTVAAANGAIPRDPGWTMPSFRTCTGSPSGFLLPRPRHRRPVQDTTLHAAGRQRRHDARRRQRRGAWRGRRASRRRPLLEPRRGSRARPNSTAAGSRRRSNAYPVRVAAGQLATFQLFRGESLVPWTSLSRSALPACTNSQRSVSEFLKPLEPLCKVTALRLNGLQSDPLCSLDAYSRFVAPVSPQAVDDSFRRSSAAIDQFRGNVRSHTIS